MVDVRGDVLRPPHGTTPAAVKANKIKKLSSFKSNENIHKREDGSYYVVSANKAKCKLNGDLTVFTAELIAIREALKCVEENKPKQKTVILTDSLRAVQTLMTGTCKSKPDIPLEIENLIDKIMKYSTTITLG